MPDTPYGCCECGCGRKTKLARDNDASRGNVKGEPQRFIRGHAIGQPVPVMDRIYARMKVTPLGCWEYQGYVAPNGYGMTKPKPGAYQRLVHRLVYEAEIGPIPEGLTLDHLCMNTRCFYWAHLEPVTLGENVTRHFERNPFARGRGIKPTHCKHGHKYDEANTYIHPGDGSRSCRACARERREERKAAALTHQPKES